MCYTHQPLSLENDWLIRIGSEYLSVTTIKLYFGEIVWSVLLAYHYITRCDTTAYPVNIGKVRTFQKLIEKQAFYLLENLGSHINYYNDVEHAIKFFLTIMYSGLPRESITETLVRMYQKQKIKLSSQSVKRYQKGVPPFQNHPPWSGFLHFLKIPHHPPPTTLLANQSSQVFLINRNATVKLSSVYTIHIKQQHNVGFVIF